MRLIMDARPNQTQRSGPLPGTTTHRLLPLLRHLLGRTLPATSVPWACQRPRPLRERGCRQVGELCGQGSGCRQQPAGPHQWAGGGRLGLEGGFVSQGWPSSLLPAARDGPFVAGEFKLGYSRCCSLNIIFIFHSHFFGIFSLLWRWQSSRRAG